MTDNNKLVLEFSEITGGDPSLAEGYLETSNWNLQDALAKYYDNRNTSLNDEALPNGSQDHSQLSPVQSPKRPKIRVDNVTTLKNLDEDTDNREAFYAGGSEFSGQQILGPQHGHSSTAKDEEISRLLKEAQERSSESSPEPHRSRGTFSGIGYRLGQTDDDPILILDDDEEEEEGHSEVTEVVLKLWREGFSVDDGPLREYAEPTNWEFLNTVMKGRIPEELRTLANGGEVRVTVKDNRKDKYEPPKIRVKAFTGLGYILGSPCPTVVSSPECVSDEDDVVVNNDKPLTTIQVRLVDGTCCRFQLNHTHTISDLKKLIVRDHPQFSNMRFVLVTSFPSKELQKNTLTLEEAGILSSTILQRLK